MNDQIKSITLGDALEELDVEGLSEYLPDKGDDSADSAFTEIEGEKSEPKEIEIQVNYRQNKPNTYTIISEGDLDSYNHQLDTDEENYSHSDFEETFNVDKEEHSNIYSDKRDNYEKQKNNTEDQALDDITENNEVDEVDKNIALQLEEQKKRILNLIKICELLNLEFFALIQ